MKYTKLMNPTSDKRETANVWNNVVCNRRENGGGPFFFLKRREKEKNEGNQRWVCKYKEEKSRCCC